MKLFMKTGIAFIAMLFMLSCTNTADDTTTDFDLDNIESKNFNAKNQAVTVPFKSSFYTEQEGDLDPEGCEGDGIVLNTQVGGGNGTHIGKFTAQMDFCMNINEGPDFAAYWGGDGVFIAANGDELYITVSGQVLMYGEGEEHDPFYVAYFDDEFEFVGGTGRFVGATGGGMTNSFTNFAHTDHNWTGTLTLLPGKI